MKDFFLPQYGTDYWSILKSLAAFVKIALFDPIGTVYIPMWLCLRIWYLTQSTVVTHHFPSTNTAKTGGYTAHFQVPHANIILLVIYPRCIPMISPLSHYVYIYILVRIIYIYTYTHIYIYMYVMYTLVVPAIFSPSPCHTPWPHMPRKSCEKISPNPWGLLK